MIAPDEFQKELENIEKDNDELYQFVNQVERPTLCLYYEDLLREPSEFLGMIFDFLGVDHLSVQAKTRKNTSDDLRAAVENFDELYSAYMDSKYKSMFE